MSTVPEDPSPALLPRLEGLIDEMSQIAARDPQHLVDGAALHSAVRLLSEASGVFLNHRLIDAVATPGPPTTDSPPQPAADLLLAAELLHGALGNR